MNNITYYTPRVTGAKSLGVTEIICKNPCGGYNAGAHEYIAKLLSGEEIKSVSAYGNKVGLKTFKKMITERYCEILDDK
jgi:hypothetical protein